MKKLIYSISLTILLLAGCSKGGQQAIISTEFGDITIVLYDETPTHRDNFIKLVKEGFYEDLLFHRVMNGFMIQGGDPNSRNSPAGAPLGNGGPGYTLPANIGFPHFKGALAAARQPDTVNPERASSGSQFYIVHGKQVSDAELTQFEQMNGITYSPEQREMYKTIGGAPFLDTQYTVYGEVVDGLDVVDKIAAVSVDPRNRPFEDIKMSIRLK